MQKLVDNKIDVSFKENRANEGIENEISTNNIVNKFIPFTSESTGTSQD